MNQLLIVAAIAAAILGTYWLYINGYMHVQSKRALVFIGSMGMGGNQCHARFTKCTGYIQRVLRFRETGEVVFTFIGTVSRGGVDVRILDGKKQLLLVLNPACPTGALQVEKNARYYLKVSFEGANGEYRLRWE